MASQVILKKSSIAARVPVVGDLAFGELALNYTDGLLYYKKADGITIGSFGGSPTSTSTYTRTMFTATAGQTVFSVAYTVGYITVYYNGILQPSTEYTATNGTSITLTVAAVLNDTIETIAYALSAVPVVSATNITGILPAASGGTGVTTATGTGSVVLNTSPTLVTPILGAATATSITSPAATSLILQSAGTTALTIDTSQNVGIGTSSPSAKLDVAAAVGSINVSSTTGTNYAKVQINNTGGSFQLGIENSAGGNFGAPAYSRVLWNDGAYPTVFYTSSTERMRIDAAGNVGIGTTSPSTYGGKLSIASTPAATQATVFVLNPGMGSLHLGFAATSSNVKLYNCYATGLLADGKGIDIDAAGSLLVGTTSAFDGSAKIQIQGPGQSTLLATKAGSTSSAYAIGFYNPNGLVGGVFTNASTTAYLTSSDYRLKENIQPMQNALSAVAQLNPVTYTWKADGSDGQGFIAHELQAVVPDCVAGEKDAVDAEGKPVYQGIDTSFLMATLTAAIQEQQILINTLTTRLTALENK